MPFSIKSEKIKCIKNRALIKQVMPRFDSQNDKTTERSFIFIHADIIVIRFKYFITSNGGILKVKGDYLDEHFTPIGLRLTALL